jgi:hypothetical protein
MHSKFSPSSISRIKACPPSFFASYNLESEAATEGTEFARFAELFAKGQITLDEAPEEFRGYLEEYGQLLDEYGLTLSNFVYCEEYLGDEETGGTPDYAGVAIPYQDNVGVVIDIKFGMGVEVFATENRQLLSYAKELLNLHPELETFRLVVWQPRVSDSLKEWVVTKGEVESFRDVELPEVISEVERFSKIENTLDKKQRELFFMEGDHCQFCPRKLNCPKKAEPAKEALTVVNDGTEMVELTSEQVYELVKKADKIKSVLRDAEALVNQQLRNGEVTPDECGMKIIATLGNRKWKDDAEKSLKRKFGVSLVETKKLRSPNQLKSELKAADKFDKQAESFIDSKVERPEGFRMVSQEKKGDHVIPAREAFTDFLEE